MAGKWTEEQQSVIDHRGGNLLVSAAAGSGKTAVLVERIIRLVTDPEHPVDIDRLLVLTFTRAAAGEMRERISAALEERLAEHPDDTHLQEQSVLIHHAQITTIHGFCTWVIQNYFQRIGIDPGYRIAEEGELLLMRSDIMNSMLEEEYAEGSPMFTDFMEAYAPGRDDSAAGELIQKIYDFAMSHPDPEKWLRECVRTCDASDDEELSDTLWMQNVLTDTRLRLEGALENARTNLRRAEDAGLDRYTEVLKGDIARLENAHSAEGFGKMQKTLKALASRGGFEKWPPFTKKVREELTGEQQILERELKTSRPQDAVKKLVRDYYASDAESLLDDLGRLKPYMEELVRLVLRFRELFDAKKREKNIADFSDLEHLALQVLVEKDENGNFVRTDAAVEIAGHFDEVMTDEYQDSNYLQETILAAVSGADGVNGNRFMVGDMKQSIYGFRMARPGIFLSKYNSYAHGEGEENRRNKDAGTLISLTKNFRSRHEVLDTVNAFFERLMIPELGGIGYDDAQALHAGADYYPESPDGAFPKSELLLINRENTDFAAYNTKRGRIALEASAVAARIKSIVGGEEVCDKNTGRFRPAEYRDCVVLLRTMSGWAEIFAKTLQDCGIPAYALSRTGYFSATEIQTVLSYLMIVDNPRQDIPMAAVLRSPMAGLDDSELARIRIAYPGVPYFEAVSKFAVSGPEDDSGLKEKLVRFTEQLQSFRKRSAYTPVHELIQAILDETGYGNYAACMPAGAQRQANLKMLVQKAVDYEKTSYNGVFNFVRYIKRLKKYNADEGEVNVYGETGNIVRIMSMHTSKGLEFPIVFVSGLSKLFNQTDERGSVVMHADLGIGMQLVDLRDRTKKDTVLRAAIRKRLEQDDKGEELRVLYVAMTRAGEKLILTGTTDDDGMDRLQKEQCVQDSFRRAGIPASVNGRKPLPYDALIKAKSFLDWITMAVPDRSVLNIHEVFSRDIYMPEAEEKIRTDQAVRELERDRQEKDDSGFIAQADFSSADRERAEAMLAWIGRRDEFDYPYSEAEKLPAKLTVTELKRAAEPYEPGNESENMYPAEPESPYIPSFAGGQRGREIRAGAGRGTVYHHFLQCLDYRALPEKGSRKQFEDAVSSQIVRMKERGILSDAEGNSIRTDDMARFLVSGIGMRMRHAARAGALYREQPFVMDVPAKTVDTSFPSGENILIQGTIDAYFIENGHAILVDYKTDRAHTEDGSDLREKYSMQLAYYGEALERALQVRVSEKWIYSFGLGRPVRIGE